MKLIATLVGCAFAVLSTPTEAAIVVTVQQVNSDVVATTTGSLNLVGLEPLGVGSSAAGLNAQIAIFSSTDASSNLRFYRGVTGPGNFGPGAQTFVQATTAIGDAFYISGFEDSQFIAVGQNYVSGLALAATTTFANKSFATLGINPGEYVFTTPSDTVTLRFIAAPGPVPEPATWAMMLVGFGMIGAAVRRRQRTAITFA